MHRQEPTTWQELLGQLITSPQERVRLATAIHVKPITLQRWITGVTRPRVENIRLLIKNVPKETYSLFMNLLVSDYPELLRDKPPEERLLQEIPAEFYAR